MIYYLYLFISIVFEVIATTALTAAAQGVSFLNISITIAGYAVSFYFMFLCLRVIPLGVLYALWSGVGIVLVAGAGFVVLHQRIDVAALAGISLIISGVVVINLFSGVGVH